MLIPKTAANLQRALRNPNAVVLRKERGQTEVQSPVQYRSAKGGKAVLMQQQQFSIYLSKQLFYLRLINCSSDQYIL